MQGQGVYGNSLYSTQLSGELKIAQKFFINLRKQKQAKTKNSACSPKVCIELNCFPAGQEAVRTIWGPLSQGVFLGRAGFQRCLIWLLLLTRVLCLLASLERDPTERSRV